MICFCLCLHILGIESVKCSTCLDVQPMTSQKQLNEKDLTRQISSNCL